MILEPDPERPGLIEAIEQAMWDGDLDKLHELAPCGCCCGEHFHEGCIARIWSGCRGSGSMTRADLEGWIKHYEVHHGLDRDRFYGDPPL